MWRLDLAPASHLSAYLHVAIPTTCLQGSLFGSNSCPAPDPRPNCPLVVYMHHPPPFLLLASLQGLQ